MAAGAKKDAGGAHQSNHSNHVGGGSPTGSGGGGGGPNVSLGSSSAASSPSNTSGGNATNTSTSSSAAGGGDIISSSEYFAPGSVVRCLTVASKHVEGEVMAFDPATRILILKSPATNKRPSYNDVHFVNLNMVSDVTVVREEKTNGTAAPGGKASDPPRLNVARLQTRAQVAIERRKLAAKAYKAGVSPEGQKLFQAISKTLDQIDWQGENIWVMGKVCITPPYRPENVKGVSDSKAAVHVRKIIEKHLEDQRRLSAPADSSSASASAPGASVPSSTTTPSSSTAASSSAANPTSPAPTPTGGAPSSSSNSSSSAAPTAAGQSAAAASAAASSAGNRSGNNSPAPSAGSTNGPRLQRGLQQQQQQGGESGRGRQRNSPANRGGGGGGGGSNSSSPKPVYFMQ